MITAQEAKQLFDQSGAEVDEFLKLSVEQKVIDAAKGGKRFVFVFLDTVGPWRQIEQELTPLHRAVVDKLLALGYRARVALDGDKYVPRGLADSNGDGPQHQNFGIQIGW